VLAWTGRLILYGEAAVAPFFKNQKIWYMHHTTVSRRSNKNLDEGFQCHGGRKWGTWEDMDELERWRKRVKDPDGDYELDLVEEFFSNLDLN